MSNQCEHGIYLDQSPEVVFAILDDVEQTPAWLKCCTGMQKLTEGENHVGTKLKYSYKESGKSGEMAGRIMVRIPNERLTILFTDKTMDVSVDYRISNTGAGSHVVHSIDTTPKTLMAKLMSGSIKGHNESQTKTTMDNLRSYLAKQ